MNHAAPTYPIQITLPSGTTFTMTPQEFEALAKSQGYVPESRERGGA